MLYKDSCLLQLIVEIYNKEYILTQITNNDKLLTQNLKTLAFYSNYLCFPLTYEIKCERAFITEYKRNTSSFIYFIENNCIETFSNLTNQISNISILNND